MNIWASIPWNSIRFRIVLAFLSITLPLIVLLIYNNSYSVNVIHNQVAMSTKDLFSIHMKQIDDQLSEVERYLMGLTLSDSNLLTMGDHVTDDRYIMAKSSISRKFDSDLIVYPYIDGFFVYSLPRQDLVDAFKNSVTYGELTNLRKAMAERIRELNEKPELLNAEWTVQKINGDYHILRLFRSSQVYIGAWVKAETMLAPLHDTRTNKADTVLIVDAAGNPLSGSRNYAEEGVDFTHGFQKYYLTGKNKDYLVVGETSSKGKFSLAVVIPDKQILENLPYLANAAKLVTAMAFAMLLFSIWSLRKVLLLPLRRLMVAMRMIGEGNLHMHIDESPAPDEFKIVNRTFNRMITQIEELKIHVYEEQLSKQQAELKHLQLQINPHFFMNSLNILYNLAQVKQFELIQDMTMCLVHYFRYMFQSNQPLVQLKDELQHIHHYLKIQQMRLPDRLITEIRVPDYLQETLIPPLILQTIVENTIKHSIQMDGAVTLSIEATLDMLEADPTVILFVRDTGKGFSDAALETIRSGKQMTDEKGAHIGLWNARERLRLQFGNNAWLDCYNGDPQGAIVEIGIPLHAKLEYEEEQKHAPIIDRR